MIFDFDTSTRMITRYAICDCLVIFTCVVIFLLSCPAWTLDESPACTSINYAEKIDSDVKSCVENNICNKTFRISYINTPPYNYGYKNGLTLVEYILQRCCGPCVNSTVHTFRDLSEVNVTSLQGYQFIYPILSPSSATNLHGFHYLPYDKLSTVVYITKTETTSLFLSILSVYPLIIVCIGLSVVSGFIGWILETWSNREEFPRSFLRGWFEGFWWSFVSMTTVGYGDRTPKTFAARLYSVVWILIGIVAFSLVISELTGKIVKLNAPPPPTMKGKNVGVLRYRDYDAYVVATHGGKIVRNDDLVLRNDDLMENNFVMDLLNLILKLQQRKIHGFVLDPWTMYNAHQTLTALESEGQLLDHATRDLGDVESEGNVTKLIAYFFTETTRVEKSNKGKELSYGMLIRHKEDYDYIRGFVEGNQIVSSIHDSQEMMKIKRNEMKKAEEHGKIFGTYLFSPSGSYFKYSIIAITVMVVVIIVFGTFYELKRQLYMCSKPVTSDVNHDVE